MRRQVLERTKLETSPLPCLLSSCRIEHEPECPKRKLQLFIASQVLADVRKREQEPCQSAAISILFVILVWFSSSLVRSVHRSFGFSESSISLERKHQCQHNIIFYLISFKCKFSFVFNLMYRCGCFLLLNTIGFLNRMPQWPNSLVDGEAKKFNIVLIKFHCISICINITKQNNAKKHGNMKR